MLLHNAYTLCNRLVLVFCIRPIHTLMRLFAVRHTEMLFSIYPWSCVYGTACNRNIKTDYEVRFECAYVRSIICLLNPFKCIPS